MCGGVTLLAKQPFEGWHTNIVQLGMRYGMVLFITSEVMFFFAFFWAFFHSSMAPTVEIGTVWPPKGIEVLSAWEVPLLNTVILLTSGFSCTWAHHAIVVGSRRDAILGLLITLILAVAFTGFQVFEYTSASFGISDGVYGSTFYMATGFHGFHVFIGTCFLTVCFVRLLQHHFTQEHHFGFEAAMVLALCGCGLVVPLCDGILVGRSVLASRPFRHAFTWEGESLSGKHLHTLFRIVRVRLNTQ